MTKFLLLSVFLVANYETAAATEISQYEVDGNAAQTYAVAYAERDLARMSEFLADDAVFVDPSNRFEGRDAILAGLGTTFEKITSSGQESRPISDFRSGNDFVFTAFIDFNMLLTIGEQPEKEFNFKVDFAMVFKVADGKIVQHTDYIDTNAFVAQVQAQLAEKEE